MISIKKCNYEFNVLIITEYLSHLFGSKFMDTLTCLTCNQNNPPRFLVYKKLIISFDGISFEIIFQYIMINVHIWHKIV